MFLPSLKIEANAETLRLALQSWCYQEMADGSTLSSAGCPFTRKSVLPQRKTGKLWRKVNSFAKPQKCKDFLLSYWKRVCRNRMCHISFHFFWNYSVEGVFLPQISTNSKQIRAPVALPFRLPAARLNKSFCMCKCNISLSTDLQVTQRDSFLSTSEGKIEGKTWDSWKVLRILTLNLVAVV